MSPKLIPFRPTSKLYVIPGTPVPLSRVTITNSHEWHKKSLAKDRWRMLIEDQHDSDHTFKGPLSIDITFYFKPTHSKETKLNDCPVKVRPDLTSLINWVLDCCNQFVYDDETQLASIKARKIYGEPRVEFRIAEIGHDND